jgi:hypothetical protein
MGSLNNKNNLQEPGLGMPWALPGARRLSYFSLWMFSKKFDVTYLYFDSVQTWYSVSYICEQSEESILVSDLCFPQGTAFTLNFFFLRWEWGLNSGLHASQADTSQLEPHLHSIFDLVVLKMRSHKLFDLAGLEPWSPGLSLPSS